MFVVTGGGSGIGRALAHALATRDKDVLIVGRREACLIETAAYSPLISYVCADISSNAGRKQVAQRLKKVTAIPALIHNAGTIEPILPITAIGESAWRQAMATNLEAPLFLTQLLHESLIDGRVLNIGSGAAHFPIMGWAAYCVSKAALSMLTRCFQLESHRIAFASVMPGIIDTDMQAMIRQASHMDATKLAFFKRLQRHDQLLTPETVAHFLAWLLLDVSASDYVSKEWDIYDKTHQELWLKPPYHVPTWSDE